MTARRTINIAISDFKYAVRLLAKSPGFTLLTTLVMATGIGLSLFLFSFFNTTGDKALPFKDGESLVIVNSFEKGVSDYGRPLSLHDYFEIRTNLRGLSEFGAYRHIVLNVSGRDGARRYNGIAAEPNIFQITRTKPILGREFTDAENQTGAENVVVIGFDMWQNQFGADPKVIEKKLRINGESHQIIGVMPQGYFFPARTDIWIPMREDATKLTRGNAGQYYGMAHLDDGVSMQDIDSQLSVIMQRIEHKYPKTNNDKGAYVATLQQGQGTREGNKVIYSMYIVAILILVLASINVGNLLLSRAVARGKETAIRIALGAPRSRLISQMLWESIIICCLGGVIGLLLTAWGLEVLNAIVATFWFDKPVFWWKFALDIYTLKIFTIFVLITILVTGLFPAWKNSGGDFNAVLRDGTRGALGRKSGRLNRILVISEIFLSMTVMIAASVIVAGSYIAARADYGANTENILTARVLLSDSKYNSPEEQAKLVKALQSRLENSAGIGDVMISSALPGVRASSSFMALEGKEYSNGTGHSYPKANYINVTAGSLLKLGVELRHGRYFNSSDQGLGKSSIIVTDSFAERHFPEQSAIGKRVRLVEPDEDKIDWLTIIGVVEHTVQGTSESDRGKIPSVFRPFSQAPGSQLNLAMQMKSARAVVTSTLRETLKSIDPELPAYRLELYTELIARNSAPVSFISKLLLLFGLAAVVLASSGIYGVMSNTINQRTQEIGVKRALGACEPRITKEFLLKGLSQLLWGGIPGLLAGSAMGFAMSQVIAKIENSLLLIIAVLMITIITGVVMLATYLPTRRVLQMEPSNALHYE